MNEYIRGIGLALLCIGNVACASGAGAMDNPVTAARARAERLRQQQSPPPPPPAGVKDMEWSQLSPRGWNAERSLQRLNVARFADSDPRVDDIMKAIRADWDTAPVVQHLSNAQYRFTGFALMDKAGTGPVTTVVLAPYDPQDACIHTPYPPANQMILLKLSKPIPRSLSLQPIWVIGKITVSPSSSAFGKVAYAIVDGQWEPYPVQKYPLPAYFWPR